MQNVRGYHCYRLQTKNLDELISTIIEQELTKYFDQKKQGFVNANTTEQIFILRNIIKQSDEWQSALYINFIVFEKAFYSIHRDVMRQYGIYTKQIHKHSEANVYRQHV